MINKSVKEIVDWLCTYTEKKNIFKRLDPLQMLPNDVVLSVLTFCNRIVLLLEESALRKI
jgi:hypothetical protein